METSTSTAGPAMKNDKPHQPHAFKFPKRTFGKKNPVSRSFQSAWFQQWPFLHYDESKDLVFCHTCLVTFKEKKLLAANADAAFVSISYPRGYLDSTLNMITILGYSRLLQLERCNSQFQKA